jgi:Lon protease-like protein
MAMDAMPLFPLSAVLFPHGRMPLQIFERRYVDLVRDSMRSGSGFGIVRIVRGAEAEAGNDLPELEPVGTVARIVDWDQLDNGLLGITVLGGERFRLRQLWRADSGLCMADVDLLPALPQRPMEESWLPFANLLRGLEAHPHVQRIGMQPDLNDPWQVAYGLLQLLPLGEDFKAELLALDDLAEVLAILGSVLADASDDDD